MPTGVSMLPRLAAMVWSTTTGSTNGSMPAILRTAMAKGTNVINATSLVIAMLKKKHRNTSTADTAPGPFT